MNKLLFAAVILAFGSLFMVSCNDDDTSTPVDDPATLNITFRAMYGSSPLVMFETQSLNDTLDIFFSRFSFYMSDLELLGASNSVIKDVEMVDVSTEQQTSAGAAQGASYSFSDLEAGTYTGLTFGIGVNAANNAQTPANFPNSNPLSDVGEYWSGWQSYVFSKSEGKIDADQDGIFEADMALHLGADNAYRMINFNKDITLENGKTTNITVEIDLEKVLKPTGGTPYDLMSNPQIHSPSQEAQVLEIADNLQAAFFLMP